MKLARLGIAAAAMFAMTGAASAATIPLTLTGPIQGNTVGPQSQSDPCIIAGTACSQPATMGFGNFAQGGASSFDQWSDNSAPGNNNGTTLPTNTQGVPYTVGTLQGAVGSSFVIAIDVNTAGGTGGHMETLQLFEVLDKTTNTVLYNFVGPQLIGNIANNGNGFADWTLGTISLAGLPVTDQILFHAKWNNASDGAESFFLVPSTGAVPEPATWGMMLLGFVGLGFTFRQSRRKVSFA